MKLLIPAACVGILALTACGKADPPASKELSQLDINSAKRQCVSVAVLQQVPNEAATDICGCTVDKLIQSGKYSASAQPTDEQQQHALEECIDLNAGTE